MQGELDALQTRGAEIAEQVLRASDELDATRQRLIETRSRLDRVRGIYDDRVELLEEPVCVHCYRWLVTPARSGSSDGGSYQDRA